MARMANIPETTFSVKFPSASEIRENKTSVELIGEGTNITVHLACTPLLATKNHISFGVDPFGSRDWTIRFDEFPESDIALYASRGRPRKDLTRAQVRGQRSNGKKLRQIQEELGLNSIPAVSHYRDRRDRS